MISTRPSYRSQRGMSLIELMIALTLMLLVLYAVTNLYVSTKITINTQAGINRVAENAQSSIDLLSRSLRQAAFVGCPSVGETSAGKQRIVRDSLEVTGAYPQTKVEEEFMARIFVAGAPNTPSTALANSPVIELMHAASGGAHLREAMTTRNTSTNPLKLTGNPGFKAFASGSSTLGILSHCGLAGGEIFEVTNIAEVSNTGWNVTTKSPLRTTYDTDTRVYPLQRIQYFVEEKTTATIPQTVTNVLYMRSAGSDGTTWGAPVAIIQDVDNLDIVAELDTDVARDYSADETKSFRSLAATEFHRIVGFQLQMALNTPSSVRGTDGKRIKREFRPWITVRARAT